MEEMNTILEYCPVCEESHELLIKEKLENVLIKGESVEYTKRYYYCTKSSLEFLPGNVLDENILRANDLYRKKIGLLTSEEIKNIRNKYKLTQKDFANLLGWGDITIQRYESKKVQDETYDSIIRKIGKNPNFALENLEKHRKLFSEKKFELIRSNLLHCIESFGIRNLKKEIFKSNYYFYSKKSEMNGYRLVDADKIVNTICYFSNIFDPLYSFVVYIFLWYSDMIFYKRNRHSITGLVYKYVYPDNILPVSYNEIILLSSNIKVVETYFNYVNTCRIYCSKDLKIADFSIQELHTLNEVSDYFVKKSLLEISKCVTKSLENIKCKNNEEISYNVSENLQLL